MKLVYETKVTSIGGREGQVFSEDKALDLQISRPKAGGGYTNPEQLFGAGYAACFSSAIAHIAKKKNINLNKSEVTANVKMFNCEDTNEGFKLAVKLIILLPELSEDDAWKLIEAAHQVCPYSQATKNNINVELEFKKI